MNARQREQNTEIPPAAGNRELVDPVSLPTTIAAVVIVHLHGDEVTPHPSSPFGVLTQA
jgi:hypothetical protein